MRLVENAKHRIVAVVSGAPDPSSGGGTLWRAAEKLGYQTWPAKLIKDAEFGDLVRSTEVDALLNVHSLVIINGAVLALPRIGSFNMHPGPLPRYAGLNAVSWAAYRRETTYGATIHRMVSEIDAGPIVYQSFFPIEKQDTPLSLTSKCVKTGLPLLVRLLDQASTRVEDIPCIPQNFSQCERFGREIPNDGRLCWSSSAPMKS